MRALYSTFILSLFSLFVYSQESQAIDSNSIESIEEAPSQDIESAKIETIAEVPSQEIDTPTQKEYVKFKKDQRQFRSWAVGLYGGSSFLYRGELTSIQDKNFLPGYNVDFVLLKNISHVFALGLQGSIGQTNQKDQNKIKEGETSYYTVSLLGDVNISSIFRRVDNKSRYRWAIHSYINAGFLNFEPEIDGKKIIIGSDDFSSSTIYGALGVGLRHKLSNALDVELKSNMIFTGEAEFEGIIEDKRDDVFFNTNLGLIYKIGGNKNHEHLVWHDPLGSLYTTVEKGGLAGSGVACEGEDADDDAVCDDWDRELTTPLGARVDGSGVALDVDGDSVIDLYDNCLTVPGVAREINDPKNGCPDDIVKKRITEVADQLNQELKNIQFDFNKATLRPVSFPKLDRAAELMNEYPGYSFIIEGHTDAAGSYDYNLKLSGERANSVLEYLVEKGIEKFRLRSVGKGESELYNPECNPANLCDDAMNEENRRVIFIPGDTMSATKSRIVEQVEIIESSNNPIEQYQNMQGQ